MLDVRKKIGEVVNLSTAAYDARSDLGQLCNVVKLCYAPHYLGC